MQASSREHSSQGASALPPSQATSHHGHLLWAPSPLASGQILKTRQGESAQDQVHFTDQKLGSVDLGQLCPSESLRVGWKAEVMGEGQSSLAPSRNSLTGVTMAVIHWEGGWNSLTEKRRLGPLLGASHPPGLGGPGFPGQLPRWR